MGKLTQRWTLSGPFFPQSQGTFFDSPKKVKRRPPWTYSDQISAVIDFTDDPVVQCECAS